MNLCGKKILVVGCGKTGLATARFLLGQEAAVTLSDSRRKIDVPQDLLEQGLVLETGQHRVETFLTQDMIIVSPGVPLFIRPVIEALARGIEVLSEIDLAARFISAPIIAVTGTNGKTTTTSLLEHMFTLAGKNIFVGGNIGTPLVECVLRGLRPEYVIAEISSFQLEAVKSFKPFISILLNISEDHLDRYASVTDYINAKSRIFENQLSGDKAILNYDDTRVLELVERIRAEVFYFSTRTPLPRGAYDNGRLHFSCTGDQEVRLATDGILLQGRHNRENILAAVTAGLLCGISPKTAEAALHSFRGLPHRMEYVATVGGVRFYNDSKGTNVGACQKALEGMQQPLVLIAGGKDKGGSYAPLRESVKRTVKSLVLIGEAERRMSRELGDLVPTSAAGSLEEAVLAAYEKCAPGDAVLLSPACSSFDMFDGYEHRGESFKRAVMQLKKGS